jgi:hypothetical protein
MDFDEAIFDEVIFDEVIFDEVINSHPRNTPIRTNKDENSKKTHTTLTQWSGQLFCFSFYFFAAKEIFQNIYLVRLLRFTS